jgi:glutathione S-transferase
MTYRSPFARKVRVALLEKGLEFEETLVDLQNKSADLLRTPIQKIPVLFDDGLNIVDSTVILEYLEERYPAIGLYPHGYLRRADARMWNQTANELSEAAIHIFMERRKPGSFDFAGIEKNERMIKRILDYAERVLGNRSYLVGNQLTIADIAMVCGVGYIEFRLGNDWRRNRHVLAHYYDRLVAMPSFAATMPKG